MGGRKLSRPPPPLIKYWGWAAPLLPTPLLSTFPIYAPTSLVFLCAFRALHGDNLSINRLDYIHSMIIRATWWHFQPKRERARKREPKVHLLFQNNFPADNFSEYRIIVIPNLKMNQIWFEIYSFYKLCVVILLHYILLRMELLSWRLFDAREDPWC